jgi:hypothetical protein
MATGRKKIKSTQNFVLNLSTSGTLQPSAQTFDFIPCHGH